MEEKINELFEVQKSITKMVLGLQDGPKEETQSAVRSLLKAFEQVNAIQIRIIKEGLKDYFPELE